MDWIVISEILIRKLVKLANNIENIKQLNVCYVN